MSGFALLRSNGSYTAILISRVFVRRGLDLGERGRSQVDPALVCQADQVDEHIRHLLGGTSVQGLLAQPVTRFIGWQPLQQFGQLADLADKG
jgi:hypothetical protein